MLKQPVLQAVAKDGNHYIVEDCGIPFGFKRVFKTTHIIYVRDGVEIVTPFVSWLSIMRFKSFKVY